MSRYDWPEPRRAADARTTTRVGRNRFVARRRAEFDPEGRAPRPRGAVGPERAGRACPRQLAHKPVAAARPADDASMATPAASRASPAASTRSPCTRTASGSTPRRANGGVWYSGNGGASWRSLGGLAATDTAGINRPAHRNACHAIAVSWGRRRGRRRSVGRVPARSAARSTASQAHRSAGSASCMRWHPAAPSEHRPLEARGQQPDRSAASTRSRSSPAARRDRGHTRSGLFKRPPQRRRERALGAHRGGAVRHACRRVAATCCGPRPMPPAPVRAVGVGGRGRQRRACGVRDTGVAAGPRSRGCRSRAGTPAAFAYPTRRGALAAGTPPTQVWAFANTGKSTPPRLYRVTNGAAAPVATPRGASPRTSARPIRATTTSRSQSTPPTPNRVVLGGSFFDFTTRREHRDHQRGAAILVGARGRERRRAALRPAGCRVVDAAWAPMPTCTRARLQQRRRAAVGGNRWRRVHAPTAPRTAPPAARPRSAAFYAAQRRAPGPPEQLRRAQPARAKATSPPACRTTRRCSRLSSSVWKRIANMGATAAACCLGPSTRDTGSASTSAATGRPPTARWSDANLLTRRRRGIEQARRSRAPSIPTPPGWRPRGRSRLRATHDVGQVIFGTTRVWYTEETRQRGAVPAPTISARAWFTLPGDAATPDPLPGDANADPRNSRTSSARPSPSAAGRTATWPGCSAKAS